MTTPLSMMAEFETYLARARTSQSMPLAMAKSRLRGMQPKLRPTREAQLVALWQAGNHTTLELVEMFDVARSTAYRPIERAGPLPVTGGASVTAQATAG